MNYVEELQKRKNIDKTELKPNISNDVTLRLELSNICNHKCLFCPNPKMKRRRCRMEPDLVYRMLREGRELGIEKAGLFITGEPFVSPGLEDYIRFAKENLYTYVFITTNGALASPARLEKVMDAGIDSIKFSINAGTKESYKIVHGIDDYDKVMEHLIYADNYRKKKNLNVKLLSSFVVTRYTKDEIDMYYEKISPYVDEVLLFYAESFGGDCIEEVKDLRVKTDNHKIPQYTQENRVPCAEIFKTICVTAEGYLACCCNEAMNYLAVEDVTKMSLKDAWYSERMQEIRKKHIENDIDGTQCYKCIFGVEREKILPLNAELFSDTGI